jgi:hypothetical protein
LVFPFTATPPGRKPTGIVATIAFVCPLITDTVLSAVLAT